MGVHCGAREGIHHEQGHHRYRRRTRSGHPSSEVRFPVGSDDVNPTVRDHGWTQELNELLTLLTRLVSLEPQQDDLLAFILAGPLITVSELTAAGVTWPTHEKDRAAIQPRGPLLAWTLAF